MDQPFKGSPVGVNLHRPLDSQVVCHLDVGIPPADMGEHHAVLVLQGLEEIGGTVRIRLEVRQIIKQRMR